MEIAVNVHGTRVVQKMVEVADADEQAEADPNPNPNPNPNLSKADPDPAKNQGEPPEQELLISAGGADRSIFQWRLVPKPGHAVQPEL